MSDPPLLTIGGPTCTGKTRLAVAVAERLGRAELINADSRQVRSGLVVGTCAPTAAELRGVRCHICGTVAPGAPYTVADWLAEARRIIVELRAREVVPIVVGGTGLYLRALLDGYTLAPPPDAGRRAQRNRVAATPGGVEKLAAELQERDPQWFHRVDPRNPHRLIRALEALDAGSAPSVLEENPAAGAIRVGLDTDRARHRLWIRERTARMFAADAPLVAETRSALSAGVPAEALARCGIGYREAMAELAGRVTRQEAEESTARRTIRYAREQRTFFRGIAGVRWFDAAAPVEEVVLGVMALGLR